MAPRTKKLLAILFALAAPAIYYLGELSQSPGRPNPGASGVGPLCLAAAAILLVLSIKIWQSIPRSIRRIVRGPHRHKPESAKAAYILLIELDHYLDAPLAPGEFLAELNAATNGNPKLYTVAHLEAFILRRGQGKTHQFPLLRPAFVRVRGALMTTLQATRQQIRPSTPLADLFPKPVRPEPWQAFHSQLGVAPPALQRRRSFSWLAVFALLPFLCLLSVCAESLNPRSHIPPQALRTEWIVSLVSAAACITILWSFARIRRALGLQLQTELPPYPRTVADLVRHLADGPLSTTLTWDPPLVHRVVQEMLGNDLPPETPLANLGIAMEFFTTPQKS